VTSAPGTWEYLLLVEVTPTVITVTTDEGAPTITAPVPGPAVHCVLSEALRRFQHPDHNWLCERPVVPIAFDNTGTPSIKVEEMREALEAHEARDCSCWLVEHSPSPGDLL
jgi:hypothetical protein